MKMEMQISKQFRYLNIIVYYNCNMKHLYYGMLWSVYTYALVEIRLLELNKNLKNSGGG